MLTLTENAATLIRRLTARPEYPERSGLRLGSTSTDLTTLAVQITTREDADECVEAGGAAVFIEPGLAATLAGMELDGGISDAAVQFTLRDRSPRREDDPAPGDRLHQPQ